jgi:hypothetical protein
MIPDFFGVIIHDKEITMKKNENNDDHCSTERTNMREGSLISSIDLQGLIKRC